MDKRPNIIIILTDDQGYGDLSRTGNTNLNTPRIDNLAADGATFDNFYVQPLCAPTRAELLTGRYFSRTGVSGVTRRAERINLDEKTIANIFSENGYKTGCFGKWHSGSQYPYHPLGRGFDEFFGYCCGHWSHYFDSTVEHNGKEVKCEGYLTDVITEKAIDFISNNVQNPFLCFVPLNTPHSPFQVPDEYFNRFLDNDLSMRAEIPEQEDLLRTKSVLAMCENIDYNVGRILDTLAQHDLTNDTIVIYLSDNGPNGTRWNAGMTGIKGSAEEGGVKSPCSITWPGKIAKNTKISEIAGAIDLLPTLTSMAKISYETKLALDGLDISPLCFGASSLYPQRLIFAKQLPRDNQASVISVRSNEFRAGGNLGGLYKIASDIGQRNDLSSIYKDTANSLRLEIQKFEESLSEDVFDPVIPIGYKEFPYTDLPAQDADLTGGITWSSIHPNASYLINWTSVKDTISWNVSIKTSGIYKVTLMITCPQSSIGSELQLSFKNNFIRNVISQSFESSVKDKDDRVIRDESYEKEFMPMFLGNIELLEGEGNIILQSTKVFGNRVCDLRAMRLELM